MVSQQSPKSRNPQVFSRLAPWDRLLAHVEIEDIAACWHWVTKLTAAGYGRFRVNGRSVMAHRFTYEEIFGPVPPGLVLDHLCRNRACANPWHLEAVTDRENILRGVGMGAKYIKRSTCDEGHPLEPHHSRGRICQICYKAKDKERKRGRVRKKRASGAATSVVGIAAHARYCGAIGEAPRG